MYHESYALDKHATPFTSMKIYIFKIFINNLWTKTKLLQKSKNNRISILSYYTSFIPYKYREQEMYQIPWCFFTRYFVTRMVKKNNLGSSCTWNSRMFSITNILWKDPGLKFQILLFNQTYSQIFLSDILTSNWAPLLSL